MKAVMRWVGVGVIGVIGAIGAWQYTSHQRVAEAEAASVLYESLLGAVRERDVPKAESLEQQLVQGHPKSPYAVLSALLAAALVPEKTIAYLQTATKIGAKGSFIHIARVRLAKAMAADQKISEALTLLNSIKPPESYIRLYEEAKGDLYVQDHQFEKAKTAYTQALQATPVGVPVSWLELKQSDLPDNYPDTHKERS